MSGTSPVAPDAPVDVAVDVVLHDMNSRVTDGGRRMLKDSHEAVLRDVKVSWTVRLRDVGFYKVFFKDSASEMVEYKSLCDGSEQGVINSSSCIVSMTDL
jgi:hypothetical protein